ncbi:DUF418 domain-containing protein [Neobacillus niacini]|uniref:DUF418 domain-containing protein n=1 Tax=Neobacillus niacini TaxID=86668 RepID=UPI0021CB035F|nr:DUF418 domain-containing protein [Neobacillus niacini]MCM3766783.1 DUF418 domain-containing protein [Neobacillus niacini]
MDVNRRIDVLDYLRGFALLGIILVNMGPLLLVKVPETASPDATYWRFLYLFVEGRFYTIFTFLFGVGFYIFITRANMKGKNGFLLFLRRAAILYLIGSVHVRFHPGEALTVYAICGLLLLPFYKVHKVINLVAGFILLVVFGLVSFKLFIVAPVMLLGIAAGQFRVFEVIPNNIRKIAVFTGIMLVLSVAGLIYQYKYAPFVFGTVTEAEFQRTQQFIDIGITIGPIVSAVYAGTLILLLQIPILQMLLSPLKSYGRMALSNYILQTAFINLAGASFDLFGNITYLQTLYVCISILLVGLIFSVVWLRYFQYGPLEWLWRAATYLTLPPIRRVKFQKTI